MKLKLSLLLNIIKFSMIRSRKESDIMAQKLIHGCIRVHDIDKTMKFYTELFDFTVKREKKYPDFGFDLIYLTVPGSDFEIELTYNYESEPYDIGNGFSHFAISVDDVEAMHKACLESEFETTEMKSLSDGSVSYFFVTDPDGYRLEVMEHGALG